MKDGFVQIGDERDIPMSLGLIVMVWNACELNMRQILQWLASKGSHEHTATIEPLISELGSVGLTQALNCYAHEFPDDQHEIATGILHLTQVIENCRAYRNYYIHAISGVTRYGFDFSDEIIENDTPMHEAMTVGPFGKVYVKSAKGKKKFHVGFIKADELLQFNNYLADLRTYIGQLETCIIHYFRNVPREERMGVPQRLPALPALRKQTFDHPKFKRPPALAPRITSEGD